MTDIIMDKEILLFIKIVEFLDKEAPDIDGPLKGSVLKTAAAHFENLAIAQGQLAIMSNAFKVLN